MNQKRDKNKKTILLGAACVLILAVMAVIAVWLWPWFSSLVQPDNRQRLQEFVQTLGIGGWLLMLGLQVLQIVVAVIPGEPVEIVMGMLYGAWGGFFTCELGILIGSLIVFFTVRALGTPIVVQLFGQERLQSYSFLQNTRRLETITFVLFFIPGTPKDILTYVAGLTLISPWRFLVISLVARIPSVLSSTLGGSSLAQGNFWASVIIFAVVGAVSLLGIHLNKALLKRMDKK